MPDHTLVYLTPFFYTFLSIQSIQPILYSQCTATLHTHVMSRSTDFSCICLISQNLNFYSCKPKFLLLFAYLKVKIPRSLFRPKVHIGFPQNSLGKKSCGKKRQMFILTFQVSRVATGFLMEVCLVAISHSGVLLAAGVTTQESKYILQHTVRKFQFESCSSWAVVLSQAKEPELTQRPLRVLKLVRKSMFRSADFNYVNRFKTKFVKITVLPPCQPNTFLKLFTKLQ